MAKPCNVCGGLVLASNEVVGYGGPICSGHHATGLQETGVSSGEPPTKEAEND